MSKVDLLRPGDGDGDGVGDGVGLGFSVLFRFNEQVHDEIKSS